MPAFHAVCAKAAQAADSLWAQAKEWKGQDASGKAHKHRLQRAKDEAATTKTGELSSADKAVTRRLVADAFKRASQMNGRTLSQASNTKIFCGIHVKFGIWSRI